jgi:hypothetical protein
VSDAADQFADRLAGDLERVLGAGILVRDISFDGDGPVRARVACLVDGQVRDLEVEATDLLDAYRRLIKAAAELRLAAAWWQIVGPT